MITTEVALFPEEAPQRVHSAVWELLQQVDSEFVPPLSSRRDTLSMTPTSGNSLADYFRAMSHESWVVAALDGLIIGFVSFVVGQDPPALSNSSPSAYATTVVVSRAHRHCGAALSMYAELKQVTRAAGLRYVTTRTWSTNDSHLRLLYRLGFEVVFRVGDERTAGIDSIYLALPVRSVATRQ